MNKIQKIAALAALALGALGGGAQVHAGPATADIDPPGQFNDQATATNATGSFVTFSVNYNGNTFGRQINDMTLLAAYTADFHYTCDGDPTTNEPFGGPWTNKPAGGLTRSCPNWFQALADAASTVGVF